MQIYNLGHGSLKEKSNKKEKSAETNKKDAKPAVAAAPTIEKKK